MPEFEPQALAPDATFHGRYRIVRGLKAGGMGAVYEVLDEVTNARRALKIMLPSVLSSPELRARFALEARVTGDIESDHIVRVSDAGIDEATGTPFLVMDLLRGEDLRTVLQTRGALPAADVVTYLFQAALALDKTHAAGIVHRDLKPDNLFVTRRDDGSPCIKVLDFGVAKVLQQGQTQDPTKPVGTPLFMSPEQIRGKGGISPKSDNYALAHIAYALLTGEPYWSEEREANAPILSLYETLIAGPKEPPTTRARRRAVVSAASPPLAGDLPAAFDAWWARAAAADPEARFERAGEAVRALAEALAVPLPAAVVPAASEQASRSRAIAAAATMAQIALEPTVSVTKSWGTGKAVVGDRSGEITAAPHKLGWAAVIGAVLLLFGLTAAALLLGQGSGAPSPAAPPIPSGPEAGTSTKP